MNGGTHSSTAIQAVHQHVGGSTASYTVAVHADNAAPPTHSSPHPTHAHANEVTAIKRGRATDGGDSYTYEWLHALSYQMGGLLSCLGMRTGCQRAIKEGGRSSVPLLLIGVRVLRVRVDVRFVVNLVSNAQARDVLTQLLLRRFRGVAVAEVQPRELVEGAQVL